MLIAGTREQTGGLQTQRRWHEAGLRCACLAVMRLTYFDPVPAPPAPPVVPAPEPDEPMEPAPLELVPDAPLPPEVSPARRSQPTAVMLSAATTSRIFDVVLSEFMLVPFKKVNVVLSRS
jgi:hypothetical protein